MPYIGTSPSQGVRRVHTYTATANQTSFSGAGAEGATLSYKDSNFVDVYQNGVKLGDADYTATSGTAIVLGTGATVSDLVVIVAYDVFSAADTVSKADGGQFDGNVTMAGTLAVTGTTALTGNATMAGTLGVTGETTLATHLNLGDSDKIKLGDSSDLEIYHDGSNSIVADIGTGNLQLRGTNIQFMNGTGSQTMALMYESDTVQLRFNNVTKLATTSGGVDITGTAVTDGLTVAGNVSIDGGTIKLDGNFPTGSGNVALGDQALSGGSLSGDNNIAIGQQTLSANTSGQQNIAIGRNAGVSNTEGIRNVFIGHSTGNYNTTSSNNTAVGYNALNSATTSGGNVAFGFNALFSNTTVSNNTGIGYESAYNTTTGGNNTALGAYSFYTNSTGAGNTAIGHQALYYNTTGGGNTAIGKDALQKNTTASNNTAIGQNALFAVEGAGHSNIAIGNYAGDAITTGDNNIVIGYNAASYSTDLVTGGQNVLIGNYITAGGTADDYANALGYNLTAHGGYTTLGKGNDDIRAAHGNVTWATVSDERYKKDIVDSTAGLSFINDLKPRTFKYKTLGELPDTFSAYKADSTEVFKNTNTNHGFIAQEVKTAIDAHSEIKDGFNLWDDRRDGSQEVAEAALIPVLVKAIQELSAKNDALEARITTLEG